ncbi:hypothetical protein C0992_002942 [Termitomyces sp. T32_za158]|nr:hypothetical protein C0992_002942 [Termitomyces sp. T32_za158]
MVRIQPTITRLPSSSRKQSTHLLRKPWHTRSQHIIHRLTTEQKARRRQERADGKATYQQALKEAQDQVHVLAEGLQVQFQKHSVNYYYEEIMQMSRLQKKRKKSGTWNAFVSIETQQMNAELPPGATKKKVHDFVGEIAAKWKLLTDDEKTQLTEEKVVALQDTRKMQDLASHNVPISAFHDTRITLDNINKEVRRLHARTGIEVLMLAVRSNKEHYNTPHLLATSEQVKTFVELTLKENLFDITTRMEAYMLSGVQAVVQNYAEENAHLHSEISLLIMYKLKEVTSAKISRMYYNNFDVHITAKYGVIIKSLPLKTFCSPSKINSRTELNVLLNSWKTDTTQFYKMTCDKFEAWEAKRIEGLSSRSPAIGNPSTLSTPLHPLEPATMLDTSGDSCVSPDASMPTSTLLSANILNTVSGGDGSLVFVTKKVRKPKKDKGIKRKKPVSPETVANVE